MKDYDRILTSDGKPDMPRLRREAYKLARYYQKAHPEYGLAHWYAKNRAMLIDRLPYLQWLYSEGAYR